MIVYPTIRQLRLIDALLSRQLLPLVQSLNQRRFHVHTTIPPFDGRGESSASGAVLSCLARFGQESAGNRRIGVKGDPESTEDWEQSQVYGPGYSIVVALVHGREDMIVALDFAIFVKFPYICR
jgi:hypothetical protein